MMSGRRWQRDVGRYREESSQRKKYARKSEEQRRPNKRRVFEESVVRTPAIHSLRRLNNPDSDTNSSLDGVPMDEESDSDVEFISQSNSQPGRSTKDESLFPDHCWVGEYLDEGEEKDTLPLTYEETTMDRSAEMSGGDMAETGHSARPELEYFKKAASAIFPDEQELEALRKERLSQSEMSRRQLNEYSGTNSLSSAQAMKYKKAYFSLSGEKFERMHDEMVQPSHPKVPPSRVFDYGHGATSARDKPDSEASQMERRRHSHMKVKHKEHTRSNKAPPEEGMNAPSDRSLFPSDRDFTYEDLLQVRSSLREQPQPISTVPVGFVRSSDSYSHESNFIPVHDTHEPSPKGLPISVLTTNYRLRQDSDEARGSFSDARKTSTHLQEMTADGTPLRIKPVFKNFSKDERKFSDSGLPKQIPSQHSKRNTFRESFNDTRKVLVDEKKGKDVKCRGETKPRSSSLAFHENPIEAFFIKSAPPKSILTVKTDKRRFDSTFPFYNQNLEDEEKKSDESDDELHARFLHRRSRSRSPIEKHLNRSHSSNSPGHKPYRKRNNRNNDSHKVFPARMTEEGDRSNYRDSRERSSNRRHQIDKDVRKKRTEENRVLETRQIKTSHPPSLPRKGHASHTPERSRHRAHSAEKSLGLQPLYSGGRAQVHSSRSPVRSRQDLYSDKSRLIGSSHSSEQALRVQLKARPRHDAHYAPKSHRIESLSSTEQTRASQTGHKPGRSRHDSDAFAKSEQIRSLHSAESTRNIQTTRSTQPRKLMPRPSRNDSRSPVQFKRFPAHHSSEKSLPGSHLSDGSRHVIRALHSPRGHSDMRSLHLSDDFQQLPASSPLDQRQTVAFYHTSVASEQNPLRSPLLATPPSDNRRVQRMQSPMQTKRFRKSHSGASSVVSDISLSPRMFERSHSPANPRHIRSVESSNNLGVCSKDGRLLVGSQDWDSEPFILRSVKREASDGDSIDVGGLHRPKRSRKYSSSEKDGRMVERIVVPSYDEDQDCKYNAPLPALMDMDISPASGAFQKEFEDKRRFEESYEGKELVPSPEMVKNEHHMNSRRFKVTSESLKTLHIERTVSQEVPKRETRKQRDIVEKAQLDSNKKDGRAVVKDASERLELGNTNLQKQGSGPAGSSAANCKVKLQSGKTIANSTLTALSKNEQSKPVKTSAKKSTLAKPKSGLPLLKAKLKLPPGKGKAKASFLKIKASVSQKTAPKARLPLKRKMVESSASNVEATMKVKQPSLGGWLEDYLLWFQDTVKEALLNSDEAKECGLHEPMQFLDSITKGNRKSMSYIPRGEPAKEMLKYISINKERLQSGVKNEKSTPKPAAGNGGVQEQQKAAVDKPATKYHYSADATSQSSNLEDSQSCGVVETLPSFGDFRSYTGNKGTATSSTPVEYTHDGGNLFHADKKSMIISAEKKLNEVAGENTSAIAEEKAKREHCASETDVTTTTEEKELHQPALRNITTETKSSESSSGQCQFRSWQDALSFTEDEKQLIADKDSTVAEQRLPIGISTEKFQVMTEPKVQIKNIFSTTHTTTKKASALKPKQIMALKAVQLPKCKDGSKLKQKPTQKSAGKVKNPAGATVVGRTAKKKILPKPLPKKTPESKKAISKKSSVKATVTVEPVSKMEDASIEPPETEENIPQTTNSSPQNCSVVVKSKATEPSAPEKPSAFDGGAASKDPEKGSVELTKAAPVECRKSSHSDGTPHGSSKNPPRRKSRDQSLPTKKSTDKPQSRTHEPTASKTRKPSSSPRTRSGTSSSTRGWSSSSKAGSDVSKVVVVPDTAPLLSLEQESLLPAFKKQVEKTALRKLNLLYKFDKYRKSKLIAVANDVLQVFSRGHRSKLVNFSTEQALYYMKVLFENPTTDALDEIDRQLKKADLEKPCFSVDEKAFFLFQGTVMELCHENLNPHVRYAVQDPIRTRYVRLRSEHLFPQFDGEAHVVIKVWFWRERMYSITQTSCDSKWNVKPFPIEHNSYKSMEDQVAKWVKEVIKCPLYECTEMSSCSVVFEVKRQLMKRKAHATRQEAVLLIARAWLKNYFHKIEKSLQSKGHSVKNLMGSEEELMVVDEVYSDETASDDEEETELGVDIAEDLTGVQVIDLF